MNTYLWLKMIHIVGATLILGTGSGIAFFMLRAYLSGNVEALKVTARTVVLADWLFTAPAMVTQVVTGFLLTASMGISFSSAWFISVIGIFTVIGLCWLPVVFIQIRIAKILNGGGTVEHCAGLMKLWMALGVPAFAGVLLLIYLMLSKDGIGTVLFATQDFNDAIVAFQ